MGAVFKARQASLDRFVALKVLPGEWNTSGKFSERFEREAKILAGLNHPDRETTRLRRTALIDRFPIAVFLLELPATTGSHMVTTGVLKFAETAAFRDPNSAKSGDRLNRPRGQWSEQSKDPASEPAP